MCVLTLIIKGVRVHTHVCMYVCMYVCEGPDLDEGVPDIQALFHAEGGGHIFAPGDQGTSG